MPTLQRQCSAMKYIYAFICLFLLSGVAHADKWLCGTPELKTTAVICGTYPGTWWDDDFKQYFYILDETTKNEDGSGKVMFREVGGKVAFNGDVCRDSTETELSCHVNSHYLSFDKTDYSFYYWRDREAERDFRESGIFTPFVNHETYSNLDFSYDLETIMQMLSASK